MRSIKIFLTLILIILLNLNYSSSQTWQWAKKAEGKQHVFTSGIAGNKIGNVYVAGTFTGASMTIDTFNLINASNSGSNDIFIVKYDSKGNAIWAKREGGLSDDDAYSITVDKDGFVYIAGSYPNGIVSFEKFNSDGNLVWTRKVGTNDSWATSITTDIWGNVYVLGTFGSTTISFDSILLTNHNFYSGDYGYDIFIAKYSSDGKVIWAKAIGGNADDYARTLITDSKGNVLTTGYFLSSWLYCGSINPLSNHPAGPDIFIAKYDSSGNNKWAKDAGGYGGDDTYGLCTDSSNNIYLAGFFATSISFGNLTLDSSATSHVFIAKLDEFGSTLWAKKAGGGFVRSLSVDKYSNCYVTGTFMFTPMKIDKYSFTKSGVGNTNDVFSACYDNYGNVVWANHIGGTEDEFSTSVFSDANNNIYLAITSRSPEIYFGNIKLLNPQSSLEIACVAKLSGVNGIETTESSLKKIVVYPNPFEKETTIQLQSGNENSLFVLYNIFGEEVKKLNFSGDKILIERDNLSSGIYFYRLQQGIDKSLTGKLIISP